MTRALAWSLIVVSLVAAAPILAGRVGLEQSNRAVELVLDLDEARTLAATVGLPVEELLGQLAGAGLTSLAVKEATPLSLARTGRLGLATGAELERLVRIGSWRHELLVDLVETGAISHLHTYLVVEDESTAAGLAAGLAQRAEGVVRHDGRGLHLVGVPGGLERVANMELGMDPASLALAGRAGLALVPRFANYQGVTAAAVDEAFRAARAAGTVSTAIFAGSQALGFPGELAAAAGNLTAGGITLGLVEHPVQRAFIRQDGQSALAAMTGYRVARVYSIARREIDLHLNPAKATEMWVRAVKERNIRVLYVRPFLRPPTGAEQANLLELNVGYIRGLAEELRLAGFRPGPAEPFAARRVAPWAAALVSLGVTGGLLLLAREFVELAPGPGLALAILGIAGTLGLFVLRSGLAVKAAALGASLVFPSLAVAVLAGRWARRPGRGRSPGPALADLVVVSALSILGGLMVAAIMGDIVYLLELDYFRGVKLSVLVPPVIAVLAYLRHHPPGAAAAPGGLTGLIGGLRSALAQKMTLSHLALFALGAAVLFLYLGRTGHEAGIPVADWEVQLRSWLERAMYARPRIKEFLIGHPGLMLGTVAALRGYRIFLLPAAAVAAMGQASLVNSFQHLRTPVLLSLLRTANGLILGALLGLALLVLAEIGLRLWERRGPAGGRRQ